MHWLAEPAFWGILWAPVAFVFSLPAIGAAVTSIASKALPFLGGLIRGAPQAAPVVTRALAPATRALAPISRALRSPVGRALTVGGGIGIGTEAAQRGIRIVIDRRTGQPVAKRIRRMNPTNVRALRRAVRRARAFMRVTRKVQRLLPTRARTVMVGRPRRRRFRGDILPFEHDGAINPYAAEDYADYLDEAEDYGFDPGFFREEEADE